jgi:hypothetical protein
MEGVEMRVMISPEDAQRRRNGPPAWRQNGSCD